MMGHFSGGCAILYLENKGDEELLFGPLIVIAQGTEATNESWG